MEHTEERNITLASVSPPCATRAARHRSPARSGPGRTRRRPHRPLAAARTRRNADVRGLGPRRVQRAARRGQVGHVAPSARSPLRVRLRPRARLKPACVQVFRAHRHAGLRPRQRLRRHSRGARRLQGLRGERGPQGARVDDRPPPGIGVAAARSRALPLARDLAVPRARPAHVGANASDGGLRRGGPELPGGGSSAGRGGCCRCRGAGRATRSGPRRSTWAACSRPAQPSASTTRSPSSTPPTRSAWSSTRQRCAAAPTRPAGTRAARATAGAFSIRAGSSGTGVARASARTRTAAAADTRAAPDRLAPHPRRPAPRARRRRERVHRGAAVRRRDLPRGPRLPAAVGVRVPWLLRAPLELTYAPAGAADPPRAQARSRPRSSRPACGWASLRRPAGPTSASTWSRAWTARPRSTGARTACRARWTGASSTSSAPRGTP